MNEIDAYESKPDRQRMPRLSRLVRCVLVFVTILALLRLTGCMESLFYHPSAGPTPLPPHLRGAEFIDFESRDGTRLCGWFIPAIRAGDDSPPPPTILHVHGNAGNMNDHAWFTEYLPAAGFNVFIFDYRGYGQSEGRARRRGGLIADTHAALDWLLKRDDVDRERIGMYGQSLGGSIGLNVMAERSEIRTAVLESPFVSWREVAASAVAGDPPAWWARLLAWLLIADTARPDEAIVRCRPRPILIVHGDADRIVPFSHGRRLKEAGGANVEFVAVEGGDHNTLRDTNPEIEERIIDFYSRHLRD